MARTDAMLYQWYDYEESALEMNLSNAMVTSIYLVDFVVLLLWKFVILS